MRRDWKSLHFYRKRLLSETEIPWLPTYVELRHLVLDMWPQYVKQLGSHTSLGKDDKPVTELVVIKQGIKCLQCQWIVDTVVWVTLDDDVYIGPLCPACSNRRSAAYESEEGQTDNLDTISLKISDDLWPIVADIVVHEHPPEEEDDPNDEVFALF